MKIGAKITFSFFLVTLSIITLAICVVYIIEKKNLGDAIFAHLSATGEARVDHIDELLEMQEALVKQLSQCTALEDLLSTSRQASDYAEKFKLATEELEGAQKVNKRFFYESFLLNREGKIVVSSDKTRIGLDRAGDEYFFEAKEGLYVKDAYYSEITKQRSLAFSAPIISRETKEFLGVVVNRVSLDTLNEVTTDRTGLGETGEIYLVNRNGYMLTYSRFVKNNFLQSKVDILKARISFENAEETGVITHEHELSIYTDYRGIRVLGVHILVPRMEWCLLAQMDEGEAFAPLNRLSFVLVALMILLPILSWQAGRFTARLIAGPIYHLRKGAEIIGQGNLDYKVGTEATDEIGDLSRAFDRMTRDLKKTTTSIGSLQREVVERKKAEKIIAESEKRYRMLFDLSRDAIMTLAPPSWKFTSANLATIKLFKAKDETALTDKRPWDVSPEYQTEGELSSVKAKRMVEKAMSGGTTFFEWNHMRLNGDVFPASVLLSKIELDGKQQLQATVRDITERKKAEEELRTSENKYKTLLENLPQKIFLKDKELHYLSCNENYARDLNIKPDEIVGKTDYDFFPKELAEKYRTNDKRIITSGKIGDVEEKYIEHRQERLVRTIKIPVRDEQNNLIGILGIFWDITDRKKAEEKTREAIEIKSEFTSMVSHELRTPLTAIKEGIAIVSDGSAGSVNDEQRDFLDTAKRNVDRLARLINDVLDFQKLEAGRVDFNIEEGNINEVVREVQKELVSLVKEKGLDFILKLDEKLPRIRFDRDKIIQVLTNLINNAVKFTNKGSITISTSREGNTVRVSVKDTGAGIGKEDIPKLFHKFEQLTKGTYRKTGGTGLGLAISRGIIAGHKGKIWAESEPGRGTTFHFVLPIDKQRG